VTLKYRGDFEAIFGFDFLGNGESKPFKGFKIEIQDRFLKGPFV
jgi:hypothetical protein